MKLTCAEGEIGGDAPTASKKLSDLLALGACGAFLR